MSREHQSRDGRRPDDERHDALNQELLEDREAASIVEAVMAGLDTAAPAGEQLPLNGWESLRAKLTADETKATAGAGDGRSEAVRLTGHAGANEIPGRPGRSEVQTTRSPLPAPASSASRWLVAMVLVAAVVVAGSWGAIKAAEAAKLRDDQRILAYWMSNPDMRMVALSEPGSSPSEAGNAAGREAAAGNPRLGIICFLPDGRALLLQPSRAPRGAAYVVRGVGAAGTEELARGRANMLQFDAGGMQSVEVVLARGGDSEVVARAPLN